MMIWLNLKEIRCPRPKCQADLENLGDGMGHLCTGADCNFFIGPAKLSSMILMMMRFKPASDRELKKVYDLNNGI